MALYFWFLYNQPLLTSPYIQRVFQAAKSPRKKQASVFVEGDVGEGLLFTPRERNHDWSIPEQLDHSVIAIEISAYSMVTIYIVP